MKVHLSLQAARLQLNAGSKETPKSIKW